MSDQIFNTAEFGRSIIVDENGYLVVSNTACSGKAYSCGSTGRIVMVDDSGRLMVNMYLPSGIALPTLISQPFNSKFYVVGSGLYFRGKTSWEKLSN